MRRSVEEPPEAGRFGRAEDLVDRPFFLDDPLEKPLSVRIW